MSGAGGPAKRHRPWLSQALPAVAAWETDPEGYRRPDHAPGVDAGGRPASCQRGHPLRWLLLPRDPFSGGEGLAACACAERPLDGHAGRAGSTPILWRWVDGPPAALRPVLPSQNRLAFALALALYDALRATERALEARQRG